MFLHKYDCIGKTHWSQKEDKFLFEYAFAIEPQCGDEIELMEDELAEAEFLLHTRWKVMYRKFVRGNALVVINPIEGSDGLVKA